ncbi:ClpP/crotonase [Gloeophyllum trabeum ATCC 11539]|uniref:ClpP/crotonase n=1 Tax=Gloeophyllum trabeum (strain ATCC 11539 / FP-39264 / Madison 617) TaxID=670483 RepID=S7QFG9_GLOTA|nr:ClpP/crotonase [Gloeophyllum trabeum ATCC 11539]EPQ58167.1 ClpP/crotonase [Gloeophyllum trabeum ATCC 11539]
MSTITVNISQGIATITLNRPQSLNAITSADYAFFAEALRDIDKREDVYVTIWQATGNWFCSGTDVKESLTARAEAKTVREQFLAMITRTTTDCGQALYSHRKVLIAALNGPVLAFLGYFDFIYCMPNAWLAVPFTFLGIIAEGGSSVSFVNRMGLAKANEVLLWGRKKNAEELLQCGFINHIFPQQEVSSFHAAVRAKVLDHIDGLDPTALLTVKRLLRQGLNDKNDPDAVNLRESYAQAERFASGIPAERFQKIARKEIKHKL